MDITRRGLLAGLAAGVGGVAGAGALVEYDVLPGRTDAYAALHLNGPAGHLPNGPAATVERGRLGDARWWIARPPGAARSIPVVLALHGAHETADGMLRVLGLDRFLAAADAPFALAAIDGGPRGYWHPRTDGRDPRGLVIDRFLPMLARHGLDTSAPGLIGWSMGGYGAMVVATELTTTGPVMAVSPALWSSYDDAAPAAFDGEDDFDAWSMFERTKLLEGVDLRIDCGRGDPFFRAVEEFGDRVPAADVRITRGAHAPAYWTRELPGQLRWLAERMSA